MGTQLSPKEGHSSLPNFRPMSIVVISAGWIRIPLGTEVGHGPGHIVLDGDPVSPNGKGHSSPTPRFRPISIVAKRSPISATAELLFSIDDENTDDLSNF